MDMKDTPRFEAVSCGPQSTFQGFIIPLLYMEGMEMIKNPSGAGIKDPKTRWYGYPGRGEIPYTIDKSLGKY
ncbi:hypothetical protein CEXT_486561 [Caerostris extrusa]|uniref:Uncharacterized protein n=1 Tax=Caerostris extrusa TaxID=172846 RepID=A0AAV4SQG1_CAEEX|nr:hypothetical protein CEXT_486561 [Caerostris extrusa]